MVGGNLPNHLGYFKEGISIKALFSWGQCGFGLWRKIRGGVGGLLKAFDTFVVGVGNEWLSLRNVCCVTREEIVVKKCTCICVWF